MDLQVIGAASSNAALVLRSHPVVQLQGSLSFDTETVNAAINQFTMTVTVR